jgi:hypothetical protein
MKIILIFQKMTEPKNAKRDTPKGVPELQAGCPAKP